MSDKDTTRAEQKDTEKTPVDPAPYLKPVSVQGGPATASLAIQVFLAIAPAVVVLATLFEDEYNGLLSMLGLADQNTTSEIKFLAAVELAQHTNTADTAIGAFELNQPGVAVTNTAAPPADRVVEPAPCTAAAESTAENAGDDETTASPEPVRYTPSVNTPYSRPYHASPNDGTPYRGYAYPGSMAHREMRTTAQNPGRNRG